MSQTKWMTPVDFQGDQFLFFRFDCTALFSMLVYEESSSSLKFVFKFYKSEAEDL